MIFFADEKKNENNNWIFAAFNPSPFLPSKYNSIIIIYIIFFI